MKIHTYQLLKLSSDDWHQAWKNIYFRPLNAKVRLQSLIFLIIIFILFYTCINFFTAFPTFHFTMLSFTLSYPGHERMSNIILPVPYTLLTSHNSSLLPEVWKPHIPNVSHSKCYLYNCKKQTMLVTLKADSAIRLGNNSPSFKSRIAWLCVHIKSQAKVCFY